MKNIFLLNDIWIVNQNNQLLLVAHYMYKHWISSHNFGHDILEVCNVLVQIQLTTNKAKPDI